MFLGFLARKNSGHRDVLLVGTGLGDVVGSGTLLAHDLVTRLQVAHFRPHGLDNAGALGT